MNPRVITSPDRDLRDARALNGRSSGATPIPLRDRIIAGTIVDENNCWIWQLAVDEDGYGQMMIGAWQTGKVRCARAYRVAYEEFVGDVPEGLELDHLCRVTRCCNPAHLEAVTHRINAQRGDQGKWQKVKTHCPKGHPYSGDNLVVHESAPNHRRCRACMRAWGSK